jgi:vancomycin resistance protein YoaR
VASASPALTRRALARSRFLPRLLLLAAAVAAVALLVPLFFAGSPGRLADGMRIAGVDVGGLSPRAATRLLRRRSAARAHVPVTFTAAGRGFRIGPSALGVTVDWGATVREAARQGGGFAPFRGIRRLRLELFPQDVSPHIRFYRPALDYELTLLARRIDRAFRDARLVRQGLRVTIASGVGGRLLDRPAAANVLLDALASLSRAPVALPVHVTAPRATVTSLAWKRRRAARILAAPVTLIAGPTRLRLPRWRMATMLDLDTLRFTGPAADAYFKRLEHEVGKPPRDATFAVSGDHVRVLPAQPGSALDVPSSAARIVAAARRVSNRVAPLVLASAPPKRTTAAAQAMGITGLVGGYETIYGGDPNRIHNVQLVAHLVDGTLIKPGGIFSFNGTTGARTAAKGFLEAPVIVNGELQTGLGGGVCQVSTTVFNAAFEAGLPITQRTNHALYISHYPLGRDATVDYPDVDLKFVNDTGHWLLLRTFVGPSSLTVSLYGAPQHRRVVSIAQPLRFVAPPRVHKTVDATLKRGSVVVDDPGVPAQSTSVERKVYDARGKLISDQRWSSSYRAEPKIVRVGPKRKPKSKPVTTKTPASTRPHGSPPAATSGHG